MPRPFTPLQAHQNEVFLDSLARTGNARLSAREAGVKYGTVQHRRSAHADFAQRWEATVAAVDARLHLAGGRRGPDSAERPVSEGRRKKVDPGLRRDDGRGFRTRGGEPVVVRSRGGRLQIRLAHPGKLTRAAEQAFLRALSATANVRLSAAAAGAAAHAFYRRRKQDPVFAREMRLALRMGYERIEAESLRSALPDSHARDRWRQCAPAPVPPMSWDQSFQLLCLHEKSVRQSWEQPHRRRRRGESDEIYSLRLQSMWRAEKDLEAEAAALRRAARYEATGGWRHEDEPPPPELPPLELVTGWSKASGRRPGRSGLALFGGWRIEDMERKLAAGAR
ncbi:MAG: hypothetical protein QOG72_309 [Sphingomonadales bacterium]|jgi:hypothetical protein|nr:hypothetical protein [Sphingomonadales bacterium]